jgi:predicted permease
MGTLIQDLRFGLRMLAKNPGFTAVAMITLALGIGANTAIFSVVNGVLLNPLPYWQPDRLVALYSRTKDFSKSSISYPNFLDWVRDNRSFSALAAYRADDFNLTGLGVPERVPAEMVSASFFSVLGVKPVIGRTFLASEDQEGARPVVLISAGFWKRKFGSSPGVLGKVLTLNGTDYTIIGVIPANFHFTENNFHRSDVYIPVGQWNDATFRDRKVRMGMDAIGRLKPGVTLEQAKDDLDRVARRLAQAYPDADKGTGIMLLPLRQDLVGDIQPTLWVLLASAGFVLLIACVNVASLLLARSIGRAREFAIRAALGASWGRVIRQMLTESVLLALAGGGLGLLVASWGTEATLKVLPQALPRAGDVHLDARVLAFTLAASLLAAILFTLAPALRTSQPALHETLKEGGRGTTGARHRVQRAFVVAETALALVLLTGAGLMIRSLAKLWSVDPGFDPQNVLTFDVSLPTFQSPGATRAAWRQVDATLAAIPGVKAVSLIAGAVPMVSDSEVPFWLEGQPKPAAASQMKWAQMYLVQPDYLKVMRTPLVRGRFLTDQDNEHAPMVAVIDERFTRMYFGHQDPIGKRINFDILNTSAEVVGIVGHVKQWGLDENAASPVPAQCYFSISQLPARFMPLLKNVGVMMRVASSSLAKASSIRRALTQVNSQVVMFGAESMTGIISDSLAARRFAMMLLGIFAALALVMSCVGIYGVISYLTGQRTHEIGIRVALGAQRRDVLRLVLAGALRMALAGVALGLVAALALTRLMAKMLFGVSAHDPLTMAGVGVVLTLVTLAACYIPARRAAKVDPVVALRNE